MNELLSVTPGSRSLKCNTGPPSSLMSPHDFATHPHDDDTPYCQENEGSMLQDVWPVSTSSPLSYLRHRNAADCAPYTENLCRGLLDAIPAGPAQQERILSLWQPYIMRHSLATGRAARLIVEKDPDYASLWYKARLFPTSTLLPVLRHPFYVHLYFEAPCASVAECVAVWLSS